MQVHLVWHVRHAPFLDGRPTEHHDDSGELNIDEQEGDDLKLLGVFSTSELAQARVDRARSEAGFSDEPDCFIVDAYRVDEDQWTEGFVSLDGEPQPRRRLSTLWRGRRATNYD